jgi:hypothetical protein
MHTSADAADGEAVRRFRAALAGGEEELLPADLVDRLRAAMLATAAAVAAPPESARRSVGSSCRIASFARFFSAMRSAWADSVSGVVAT